MADDLTRRGPEDPQKININQYHEVRYWTGKFGITEQTLRAAVSAVGVYKTDVERWLRSSGWI